jgi:hypothetical protein
LTGRSRVLATHLLLAALASCGWLTGCKAIVGIEDRKHDEDLDRDGGKGGRGGSDGGDSGRGGKGGSGGKGGDGSTTDKDAGMEDAMTPADGGDAMTPQDPCDLYCELVEANCRDEYDLYASPQLCQAVCRALPPGDLTMKDPVGNTVACRIDQARLAAITREPSDHCPHAGPGGAGTCGENCESYCMLDEAFCPENFDPACLEKCPALRDLDDERASFDESTFDVVKHHDGDFLQCRLVHVASAALSPVSHCWHSELAPRAHPDPKITEPNPCGDLPPTVPRCKDYCRLNVGVCTGDVAEYESQAQCEKLCEFMDKGTNGDYGGQNTVGCRRNHSYNALLGGVVTHCPHSGPGGHGVCGSNCESYCTQVAGACPTQFATKYEDAPDARAACLAECNAIPGHDDGYTVAGGKAATNPYFCRMLHTSRAAENANECVSALGGGECQ